MSERVSWVTLKKLREDKAALVVEMRGLDKKATDENRSLTSAESTKFNELTERANKIGEELHRAEAIYGADANPTPFDFGRINPLGDVAAKRGNPVAFGKEYRMADMVPHEKGDTNGRPLSIGKFLRGITAGNWEGAAEERAMSIGTATAGGHLVPAPLAMGIIDKARNKARVIQAGATTVPMMASTLKIARVTGDGTAAWRAENAAFANSDLSFDSISFNAKTLGLLATASIELCEDVANLDAIVEESLSKVLALELDRAALRGSGSSNQPQGIKGATGVQTLTSIGALSSVKYAPLSSAIELIADANFEATGFIYAPRTRFALENLADTTGQPLRPPESVAKIAKYDTNTVPINLGGGAESEFYCGDWSQLLIGLRTSLVLEVTREGSNASGNAFSNGQVLIRAYLRGDIQLAQPTAFVYGSGIL